jgi:hypothetical protein
VQETHLPAEHTRLLPHGEPSATFVTVSTHVDWPVAQDVTPVWQTVAGVHPRLAVQSLQLPALQTMFVPHAVPLLVDVMVSVHVATPPVHEVTVPLWHRLVGVHDSPAVHALHTPE